MNQGGYSPVSDRLRRHAADPPPPRCANEPIPKWKRSRVPDTNAKIRYFWRLHPALYTGWFYICYLIGERCELIDVCFIWTFMLFIITQTLFYVKIKKNKQYFNNKQNIHDNPYHITDIHFSTFNSYHFSMNVHNKITTITFHRYYFTNGCSWRSPGCNPHNSYDTRGERYDRSIYTTYSSLNSISLEWVKVLGMHIFKEANC